MSGDAWAALISAGHEPGVWDRGVGGLSVRRAVRLRFETEPRRRRGGALMSARDPCLPPPDPRLPTQESMSLSPRLAGPQPSSLLFNLCLSRFSPAAALVPARNQCLPPPASCVSLPRLPWCPTPQFATESVSVPRPSSVQISP